MARPELVPSWELVSQRLMWSHLWQVLVDLQDVPLEDPHWLWIHVAHLYYNLSCFLSAAPKPRDGNWQPWPRRWMAQCTLRRHRLMTRAFIMAALRATRSGSYIVGRRWWKKTNGFCLLKDGLLWTMKKWSHPTSMTTEQSLEKTTRAGQTWTVLHCVQSAIWKTPGNMSLKRPWNGMRSSHL